MKRQIRREVFETNSSLYHSITMCSKEEFDKWEKGELLFNEYEEKFVKPGTLSDSEKEKARKSYDSSKDIFSKDWDELSDDAKEKYYEIYGEKNRLLDVNAITYKKYMNDGCLTTFYDYYKTKNGEIVVAFGKYCYDG